YHAVDGFLCRVHYFGDADAVAMVATRCHRVVDVQVKRVFRGDDCREATLRPCRGAIRRLTAGDNGDRASWVCLSNGQRGGETGCPGADDEHVGALGKALSRSDKFRGHATLLFAGAWVADGNHAFHSAAGGGCGLLIDEDLVCAIAQASQ